MKPHYPASPKTVRDFRRPFALEESWKEKSEQAELPLLPLAAGVEGSGWLHGLREGDGATSH